jgi:hypothetical protein
MSDKVAAGVLLLMVVGVVGLGGIWALDTTVGEVGTQTTIEGDVVQNGTWQSIANGTDADRYSAPVTVENETRELADDEYHWNSSDAAINMPEKYNETTDSYENVTVAGVTATTLPDSGGAFISIAAPLTRVPGWMALLIAAGLVVFALRALNDRRGRGGAFP